MVITPASGDRLKRDRSAASAATCTVLSCVLLGRSLKSITIVVALRTSTVCVSGAYPTRDATSAVRPLGTRS